MFIGGEPSKLGIPVTAETALRVTPFLAAVRLLATAAGTTPTKVFSRDPKASDPKHPAYGLVHDFANEWTSAAEFREIVTTDAMLHGHGYALAIRVDDKVRELHRIDQRRTPVECKRTEITQEPFYIVGSGPTAMRVSYRDMIHIPDFTGVSSLALGKEAIALTAYLEQKVETFVSKNTQPSGIVSFEKPVGTSRKVGEGDDPETRKSKIEEIQEAFTAALNRPGGTLFLDRSTDYTVVPPANAQATELLAQRQFQIDEIARLTGVPPTMLYGLDRATWGNAEQLALQFRQFALRPWLRRWEDAYALVLLDPEDRTDHFVEFILDDLGSADQATQAEAFNYYRAAGTMTANEVRAARNLPPLPDGNTLGNPYTTSNKTETP